MENATRTWTAKQIGSSFGAYSGKQVKFTYDGRPVEGMLTRSSSTGPGRVMLAVGGRTYYVDDATKIEVTY